MANSHYTSGVCNINYKVREYLFHHRCIVSGSCVILLHAVLAGCPSTVCFKLVCVWPVAMPSCSTTSVTLSRTSRITPKRSSTSRELSGDWRHLGQLSWHARLLQEVWLYIFQWLPAYMVMVICQKKCFYFHGRHCLCLCIVDIQASGTKKIKIIEFSQFSIYKQFCCPWLCKFLFAVCPVPPFIVFILMNFVDQLEWLIWGRDYYNAIICLCSLI